MEAMEKFVHEQNVVRFRKHLAGNAHNLQREQILILLADEEARTPTNDRSR